MGAAWCGDLGERSKAEDPVPPQNPVDRTIVDVFALGVQLTYPSASLAVRPARDRPIEPEVAARARSAEPGPRSQRWRGEGGDQETKRELAYRLALCWNLAEGWPTEALEEGILRSVEDTLVQLLDLLDRRSAEVPADVRTLGRPALLRCSRSAIRATISPTAVLMTARPALRSPLGRASEICKRRNICGCSR